MRTSPLLDDLHSCQDLQTILRKNLDTTSMVLSWKADYLKLKHYRYIRNQIAHENYADESNMCSAQDAV